MPYISQSRREAMDLIDPQNAGELNYMLTRLVIAYVKNHRLDYQTINDIIGALEGAKAEFYRRVVVPYEDKKIILNGDVYEGVCSK